MPQYNIKYFNDQLSWNGMNVISSGNIYEALNTRIPEHLHYYLPQSVTIVFDKEISTESYEGFINDVANSLTGEFRHREKRKTVFANLDLIYESEYIAIMTERNSIQPWVIYNSIKGGLGEHDEKNNTLASGMIPCASMRNHGVSWEKTDNKLKMWLLTSRKVDQPWDWDSDIGHESSHSCFAPIPLFIQSIHITDTIYKLTGLESIEDLNPELTARLCYIYSEVGVVAVRGERRATESGLPVIEEPEELESFLKISHLLMPDFGFDLALEKFISFPNRAIDVNNDDIIYYIGAACLRALSYVGKTIGSITSPNQNIFLTSESIKPASTVLQCL